MLENITKQFLIKVNENINLIRVFASISLHCMMQHLLALIPDYWCFWAELSGALSDVFFSVAGLFWNLHFTVCIVYIFGENKI